MTGGDHRVEGSGDVPAWPALLDRELLAAYLMMSPSTVVQVCPVAPLELGVRLLRWRKADVDRWLLGVRTRNKAGRLLIFPLNEESVDCSEQRRALAVGRVARRAEGGRHAGS